MSKTKRRKNLPVPTARCTHHVSQSIAERLWRTVKYEDVYLKGYAMIGELLLGLTQYFGFYNGERAHQALNNRTPKQMCRSSTGGRAIIVDTGSAANTKPSVQSSRIRATLFSCTSRRIHNLN